MALPSAGNPISFKDINEEIGNTGNAELDLKTASETFGDTEPFGMDDYVPAYLSLFKIFSSRGTR